jgi:hypothetical protein
MENIRAKSLVEETSQVFCAANASHLTDSSSDRALSRIEMPAWQPKEPILEAGIEPFA